MGEYDGEFRRNDEVVALAEAMRRLELAPRAPAAFPTVFHGTSLPGIGLSEYITGRLGLAKCSSACYILCIVYVDRLQMRQPTILDALSSHRIVATAFLLAVKYHDDIYYSHGFYAKLLGISRKELFNLERRLLVLLDHRLYVAPEEFQRYRELLRGLVPEPRRVYEI